MSWEPSSSAPVTVTVAPVVDLRPLDPRLYVDGRDVTDKVVVPLRLRRGRQHPGDGFQPSTLTVSSYGPDWRPRTGALVELYVNAPASDPDWRSTSGTWAEQLGTWAGRRVRLRLFYGTVSDRSSSWAALDPGEWDVTSRFTAGDPLTMLANLPVGDEPWPSEPIVERAARIVAGLPFPAVLDPAPWIVAARDVDSQPALTLLDELARTASASGGLWFDAPTRTLRFQTGASRMDRAPALVLSADDVLDTLDLDEQITDTVNDVTVTYLDTSTPNGAPLEARVVVEVPPGAGRRETVSTQLVDAGDAYARALDHASHSSRPGARLSGVTLPSERMPSRVAAEALLVAPPTMRLRLEPLPAPAPATYDGYVEGYELELWNNRYRLALDLSPSAWSGPMLPWDEVPEGRPWSALDPALTWLETADDLRWKETE